MPAGSIKWLVLHPKQYVFHFWDLSSRDSDYRDPGILEDQPYVFVIADYFFPFGRIAYRTSVWLSVVYMPYMKFRYELIC